jgi:hypothetical protein
MGKAYAYETHFDRSIPDCGECSDLELLLILERAYERLPSFVEIFGEPNIRRSVVPSCYRSHLRLERSRYHGSQGFEVVRLLKFK